MRGLTLLAALAIGFGRSDLGAQSTYTRATHVYKQVGGTEIKADVYRLLGDEVRPAVIWIHGGGLIFGDRTTIRPDQLIRFLDAGFAVISIDYRLAPETKLPAIIEDLRDACQWVRDQGPALFAIDPNRVAVVGNSAGGYLALVAGFAVSPRPKALVSFYGYGDLAGDWTARPDPNYLAMPRVSKEDAAKAVGGTVISESPRYPRVLFYTHARQTGRWIREIAALEPARNRGQLGRLSPIRQVTRDFPPTLLLHGDRDIDVPFEESARMAIALKRHGVPHRLVRMRNYDHLFDVYPTGWTQEGAKPVGLQDPKVAAAYDDVVAFLKSHIDR